MILNEAQLTVEPVLLRTSDLLDTIIDLKRQLAEVNMLNGNALDAYVQEKMDREAWELGKKALTEWMIAHSFATGHGDHFADLLNSLGWQITEKVAVLERENHRLKLNLVEPTIQLRIDRAVANYAPQYVRRSRERGGK